MIFDLEKREKPPFWFDLFLSLAPPGPSLSWVFAFSPLLEVAPLVGQTIIKLCDENHGAQETLRTELA